MDFLIYVQSLASSTTASGEPTFIGPNVGPVLIPWCDVGSGTWRLTLLVAVIGDTTVELLIGICVGTSIVSILTA
jgi:hypothetical protein